MLFFNGTWTIDSYTAAVNLSLHDALPISRLTAELSLQCSATALIGGDLVILARAGMPQSHEGLARVGERRLMIPPMGMCHAAWAGASIVEPYLAFAKQHLKADRKSVV